MESKNSFCGIGVFIMYEIKPFSELNLNFITYVIGMLSSLSFTILIILKNLLLIYIHLIPPTFLLLLYFYIKI